MSYRFLQQLEHRPWTTWKWHVLSYSPIPMAETLLQVKVDIRHKKSPQKGNTGFPIMLPQHVRAFMAPNTVLLTYN